MESVSVDLSRWAIRRPWLCRGVYSVGCCCKERQKDTNKYVSMPWRWNLMVTFLSLTFTLIFTQHPMRLSKKEHPHSPPPSLLSYHNENFDILQHVCDVLMNFHENRSTWSREEPKMFYGLCVKCR